MEVWHVHACMHLPVCARVREGVGVGVGDEVGDGVGLGVAAELQNEIASCA